MTIDAHLLIVDDEEDIRATIEDYFELKGFVVHSAANGGEMRAIMREHPISIVILDLRLPGEDGFTLCRELRESHDVGVIMLTGSADTIDKVVGLEVGADDYVGKPFDLRELLARVKSVMRRVGPREEASATPGAPDPGVSPAASEVAVGACQLNLTSRVLRAKNGEFLPLTSMEFDLLKAFIDHPNHVLSRDQLLDIAHNREWDPYDRSIDVRVTRLRKKIEADPANPRHIKTVRGVGYMYVPDGG